MKKLPFLLLALLPIAFGATLTPVQLLNPSGSAAGQSVISTGASSAPTFALVGLTNGVSGILPSTNGGTNTAYFTVAGPTALRVFTFPDAAATVLYSGGALGTPLSGVATNLTGTAAGLTSGNVTTNANLTGGVTSVGNAATVVTNANLTGPITSSGNATAIAAQTGTGSTFAMQTNPVFVGPTLGAALATSINGNIWTTGTGTLTLGAGKTTTFDHTSTFTTTDGVTYTFPTTSATIARTDAANTFTGAQTLSGQVLLADGATATPSYAFSSETNTGFFRAASGNIALSIGNSNRVTFNTIGIANHSAQSYSWGSSGTGSIDLSLFRNGVGTFAQYNGANPQVRQLFNTRTDASNGEWLDETWASNAVTIATKANGTGTVRQLKITAPQLTTYAHSSQEIDLSYTYSQPTTGGTVTLATGTQTAIIDPAGTLATLTVTLPGCTSGYDGSIARFSSTQIVTALTVNATSGTIADAPTSAAVGGGSGYICRGSSTTWYRLY